ncbi:Uncharacterized conserved protein YlxW, UPF0749 family [Caloramator fervidus]|uniref:Uncharacterized conserved protein YlxW, UPF0749 family n=1 Tax=Caloramator fervidus TaxID=29344 RepID=A0A1H5US29_9CLOT|nr:DUF881 domain-containing protein [Caloramator fervidus]SEF77849.1 Uncharacterized conserved protein YlxW, UPF0749 family [Caloramator fervidus]
MKFNIKDIFLLTLGILCGVVLTSFIITFPFKPTLILTYVEFQKKTLELTQLKDEIKSLENDLTLLKNKLEEYQNSSKVNQDVLNLMKKELDYVKLFSGYEDVEGPGLKIIIDDNRNYSFNDDNILDYITHNSDILYVIFDLKNAGAEAISVNGKRIISTSEITCEGPVIKVNGEYIVPPFEILAIGDPDALYFAMTMPESKIKELQYRQLYVRMTKEKKIYINGFKKNIIPKYIRITK